MIIGKSIFFFSIFSFFCINIYPSTPLDSFDPTKLKNPVEEVRIIEMLGKFKIEPANPNHIFVLKGDNVKGFSFGCKDNKFIIEGHEAAFYENPSFENRKTELYIQPWYIQVQENTVVLKNCTFFMKENFFVIFGNVSQTRESYLVEYENAIWKKLPSDKYVTITLSSLTREESEDD